jgi:hypothetical protein
MILLFDTEGGLCNQILDIQSAIQFSVKHSFSFSFRYCSFRKSDVTSFIRKPFHLLFNPSFFQHFKNYIPFNSIQNDIQSQNTYNFQSKNSIKLFNDEDILLQFIKQNVSLKYIILPQFFAVSNFTDHHHNYYHKIRPSPSILSIFFHLKKRILPKEFNFIHYRFEHDFTKYFSITNVISIDSILKRTSFQKKNIPTYIACSNLTSLSKTIYLTNPIESYPNLLYKDNYINEFHLEYLNFEEKAFIDFFIGLYSSEVIGHRKSSFSKLLNYYKGSSNYYN